MKKSEDWTTAVPVFDADTVQKFWTKVDVSGGAENCWPWTASLFTDGYGCFSVVLSDGRRSVRHASKIAWALMNGRWPKGSDRSEVVMHSCDNRSCCNPRHLSLGSNNVNMADMAAKGRASQGDDHYSKVKPEKVLRGSKIGNSKLTEKQVAQIKKRMAETPPPLLRTVAEEYGVTRQLIWAIGKGKWWAHVAPAE